MRDRADSTPNEPKNNRITGNHSGASDDTPNEAAQALAASAAQIANELDGWRDELRFGATVQARRRDAWLRRQAAEDTTLAGALLDYAERRSLLSIETINGSEYVGVLNGAGRNLVALQTNAHQVLISLESVFTVNLLRDRYTNNLPVGHRMSLASTELVDLLRQASALRPEVSVRSWNGNSVTGALRAVGRDVVELGRDTGGSSYVRLQSVSEVLLPLSTRSG